MSFRVRIAASRKEFSVEPSETVLAAALRQGLALSYSCRNGSCGSCKGRVLSGSVDYGRYDETALSAAERAAGQALFCQAVPRSDLVIEARELAAAEGIPIRILPARIAQMERAAHDVMILRLKLAAGERLQFLAGQYVDILLKEGRRRSFSLANAPGAGELLELHIRRVPGGFFTEQVFTTMRERDLLRFQGPFGTFFLREDDAQGRTNAAGDTTAGTHDSMGGGGGAASGTTAEEVGQRRERLPGMPEVASGRPVVLVAGGTGFAPIKSILEHAFARGVARPLHLYWGVRARRDLYRHELIEDWRHTHPNLRYTPVLSEPAADEAWGGRRGWVHEAVAADYPDLSGHEVYASGPPPMIQALKRALAERGLPQERLYFDSFEFTHAR